MTDDVQELTGPITTAEPPLYIVGTNLGLAWEGPLNVAPSVFTSEQPNARLRFWMVRHVTAMGVDNTNVTGMDYTDLPANVSVVEWKSGVGEIEYDDRPRLRENFIDVTPYCPFFQQFMTLLPRITVAQAKKIQCDLIDVLFDSKRQMPYAYNIAAGNFTWDATDGTVAGMSIATIPQLIQNLTGTSDSTVVGKLNTLVDEINAKIVNPGNQLKGEINSGVVTPGNQNKDAGNGLVSEINSDVVNVANALVAEINSDIVSPVFNGFNSINGNLSGVNTGVVDPVNSIVSLVNSRIVTHLNTSVLGYIGDTINTINNRLQSGNVDIAGSPTALAVPGLGGNLPTMTAIDVGATSIGSNPNQVASIETNFPAIGTSFPGTFAAMTATFIAIGYASTTPDPSITPIQWTPIGQADPVILTATEMAGLMSGITTRRNNLLTTKFNKIAAVNALTEIVDVIAYDVTTGWPS
jgi:hypothetical protein